jgi:lysophospholipase L1-like esterase
MWPLAAVLVLAGCTATGSAALPSGSTGSSLPGTSVIEGGASAAADAEPQPVVRLVALGDGYTYGAGTDAPQRESWPAQLADVLRRDGRRVYLANLAETSSSSINVRDMQVPAVEAYEPDIVTLQVGSNDVLARETDDYHDNLEAILDVLLAFMPPDRIFLITTPDHTLTEWGRAYGPPEAIEAVNRTLAEVAGQHGIVVVDIGPINRLAATDPTLRVQRDPPEPYPSAKQYAGWAESIGLHVQAALSSLEP